MRYQLRYIRICISGGLAALRGARQNISRRSPQPTNPLVERPELESHRCCSGAVIGRPRAKWPESLARSVLSCGVPAVRSRAGCTKLRLSLWRTADVATDVRSSCQWRSRRCLSRRRPVRNYRVGYESRHIEQVDDPDRRRRTRDALAGRRSDRIRSATIPVEASDPLGTLGIRAAGPERSAGEPRDLAPAGWRFGGTPVVRAKVPSRSNGRFGPGRTPTSVP